MSTLLRRMRGIIGLGLIWSVIWAFAGVAAGVVEGYFLMRAYPEPVPPPFARMLLASGVSWGSYGFALGSLFASVLAIAERRQTLDQLATWRVATWGGVAGILVPLAFIAGARVIGGVDIDNGLSGTVLSASLGAGCAAGSLALARAASAKSQGVRARARPG